MALLKGADFEGLDDIPDRPAVPDVAPFSNLTTNCLVGLDGLALTKDEFPGAVPSLVGEIGPGLALSCFGEPIGGDVVSCVSI
jgi:hypothetical protein